MEDEVGDSLSRKNLHKNARLTPHGREWIVGEAQNGWIGSSGNSAGACLTAARDPIACYDRSGEPDVEMAFAGNVPTLETFAGPGILHQYTHVQIRGVNSSI